MTTRSALLCVCLSVTGCNGAREMLGALSGLEEVQRQVTSATGHEPVTVNLNNGRFLTVGMINSRFKELPDAQKEAKAREIAVLAYKAFPSRTALERVAVVFVVNRNYFFVFNVTDATDYHGFAASELARDVAALSAISCGRDGDVALSNAIAVTATNAATCRLVLGGSL